MTCDLTQINFIILFRSILLGRCNSNDSSIERKYNYFHIVRADSKGYTSITNDTLRYVVHLFTTKCSSGSTDRGVNIKIFQAIKIPRNIFTPSHCCQDHQYFTIQTSQFLRFNIIHVEIKSPCLSGHTVQSDLDPT